MKFVSLEWLKKNNVSLYMSQKMENGGEGVLPLPIEKLEQIQDADIISINRCKECKFLRNETYCSKNMRFAEADGIMCSDGDLKETRACGDCWYFGTQDCPYQNDMPGDADASHNPCFNKPSPEQEEEMMQELEDEE